MSAEEHVAQNPPTARSDIALERMAWMRSYLEGLAREYSVLEGEERLQAADRMAAFLADTIVTRIQTEAAFAGAGRDELIKAIGHIVEKLRNDASKTIEQDASRLPFASLLTGSHAGWQLAAEVALEELKNSKGVVDWGRVRRARIDVDAITDRQLTAAVLNKLRGMTAGKIARLVGVSTKAIQKSLAGAFIPALPAPLGQSVREAIEVMETADAMVEPPGSPYQLAERNAKHLLHHTDPKVTTLPDILEAEEGISPTAY
jgi:hypothetical protein